MREDQDRTTRYEEGSLSLPGTVMLGTGVMIGAGIFALTGQMAQMTGVLFPLAFLAAAVIVSFSAYSYIKISNAWPSAGGILASIFVVSRMLAMLTEMKLVPHRHFHMPGSIQKHTLVYTVVLGVVLTAFYQ